MLNFCVFCLFKGIVNIGIEGMYKEVGVRTILKKVIFFHKYREIILHKSFKYLQ